MAEISAAIRESRIESLSHADRPRESLAGHRRIAEAIRAGDAEAAAECMAEHIRLVSDVEILVATTPSPPPPGRLLRA
jgi:GntR family transcriptional repressor for pyruvate dehydrogenase complex